MSREKVRVLRVLEYIGTREAVELHLKRRGVVGQIEVNNLVIREAILGEFPEILEKGGE